MKGQGRCYLFTKAVFSRSAIFSPLGLQQVVTVNFHFSGLLARAFELARNNDQIHPKPVYLMLSIWDHNHDPTKEKPMLYDKNIESLLGQR